LPLPKKEPQSSKNILIVLNLISIRPRCKACGINSLPALCSGRKLRYCVELKKGTKSEIQKRDYVFPYLEIRAGDYDSSYLMQFRKVCASFSVYLQFLAALPWVLQEQ